MTRLVMPVLIGLYLTAAALLAAAAPPGPDGDAAARGQALYRQKCAVCHGATGKGDGPAEFVLFPKPRDLTSGKFKIRSTLTLPTDADLLRVLTDGIPGTAMPGWGGLTAADRAALVAHVKTLSPVWREQAPAKVTPIPPAPRPTSALLALGQKFYAEAECLKCHGATGKGDGPSADGLKDEWGYPIVPYDFTTAGRMKGGSTARDVYRTLANGIGGTPMPAYGDALSPEETWGLAYYVLSLAKKPAGAPAAAPVEEGTVRAARVAGDLPLDPAAAGWRRARVQRVPVRTLWLRPSQITEVRVAALHNGRELAVLLEWNDRLRDEEALGVDEFRDAVAVQFPLHAAALHGPGHPEPSYVMGEAARPVNIWHWKADWQLDLVRFRDRQDRFPATVVDDEPFRDDPLFLTGRGATNPMSRPRRSPVENLNAAGVGTITSQPPEAQVVRGVGRWADGRWRVVLQRPLSTENPRDAQFAPGQATALAVAVWDGAQRDRDGQKAVSVWQRLVLDR